jgi:predicted nucleotidyltransferase
MTDPTADPWLARLSSALADAAGPGADAALLGGSHAAGDAVWLTLDGRRVTLSDVDAWVIAADEPHRREVERRLREELPRLREVLADLGLVAPIDVSALTPRRLERMPIRPATLELRGRGRMLWGDPALLSRVPDAAPASVPLEERLLLLENRAFELLLAWPGLGHGDRLRRAIARHGVLKTAVDLALVIAMGEDELPLGAAARIARARALLATLPRLAPLRGAAPSAAWDQALAWRAGDAGQLEPASLRAEWRTVARAGVAVWRHASGTAQPRVDDDWQRVLALAARARLRRRLRLGLAEPHGGSLAGRLRRATRGTPLHRLNASAVAMLVAAGEDATPVPALGARALRVLARLGVLERPAGWDDACVRLVRLWDTRVLDGQRTAAGT